MKAFEIAEQLRKGAGTQKTHRNAGPETGLSFMRIGRKLLAAALIPGLLLLTGCGSSASPAGNAGATAAAATTAVPASVTAASSEAASSSAAAAAKAETQAENTAGTAAASEAQAPAAAAPVSGKVVIYTPTEDYLIEYMQKRLDEAFPDCDISIE